MKDEREMLASYGEDRIDISDAWQVLHWCRMLNITRPQLEEAVHAVGDEPEKVRAYFAPGHKKAP